MTNTNKKSGFTLIETLVVISIIAILAGITLTGIGGFTSRARDTRRIADLRSIQNYLEFYQSKCGLYPGTATCAAGTPTSWSDLVATLAPYGKVPNDPVSTRTYFYGIYAADSSKYILGAKLENDNKILTDPADIDPGTATTGFNFVAGTSSDCADTSPTYGYCIGS